MSNKYLTSTNGCIALTNMQYNCLEVAIDHLIDHLEEVCTEERDYRNVDVELEAAKGMKNILRMLNNDFEEKQ